MQLTVCPVEERPLNLTSLKACRKEECAEGDQCSRQCVGAAMLEGKACLFATGWGKWR